MTDYQLLVMWIVFSVVALAGVIAVFTWAVRARQFSNQDRARRLALDAQVPPEDSDSEDDTDANNDNDTKRD